MHQSVRLIHVLRKTLKSPSSQFRAHRTIFGICTRTSTYFWKLSHNTEALHYKIRKCNRPRKSGSIAFQGLEISPPSFQDSLRRDHPAAMARCFYHSPASHVGQGRPTTHGRSKEGAAPPGDSHRRTRQRFSPPNFQHGLQKQDV